MGNVEFRGQSASLILSGHSSGDDLVVGLFRRAGTFDDVIVTRTQDAVYGAGETCKARESVRADVGKVLGIGPIAYDWIVLYGHNPWLCGIGNEKMCYGKTDYWSPDYE